MNRHLKLIHKWKKNPHSLPFRQIETILLALGFEKRIIKGSHIKFCHPDLNLLFSPHQNEVKNYQKSQALKKLLRSKLLS